MRYHEITQSERIYNYYMKDSSKQYYIYDFAEPSDSKSVIGITIDKRGGVKVCCLKKGEPFENEIQRHCIEKGIPFKVLDPAE